MALVQALSLSGRLKVSVSTPWSTEESTSSAIRLPNHLLGRTRKQVTLLSTVIRGRTFRALCQPSVRRHDMRLRLSTGRATLPLVATALLTGLITPLAPDSTPS